ncbi:hypothetical protein SAMN05518672_103407 [Chitinophaga sp. CF118]|uniref:hypothetical protein n=1 Tax=Chitinophaga sp. CF118 TaxID=1884367 RepID=UPI0008EC4311|nr:hypothetical protein [Chitinophaga sp. CF118]SFD83113.1 hypothetical protein SAMN05518672_103407 [Chitinophaga sp. CF118]
MRTKPIYVACCILMPLLFGACTKQMKENPTEKLSVKSTIAAAASQDGLELHKFLRDKGPAFERFTINLQERPQVKTKSSTIYTFTRNSLVYPNGSPVTGNVTISIKEISTPSNMIFADRQTSTSTGEALVSYGEFFVSAQQGGVELKLRPDSAVIVQVPARQGELKRVPMWAGDTTITVSTAGFNYVNQFTTVSTQVSANKGVDWQPVTSSSASFALFDGTTSTYNFRLDSLMQWRNCDALANSTNPKTTVLVYFNTNYNPATGISYTGEEPSMLYFKPLGQNTIIKLYNTIFTPPAGFEGFLSYQNTIPVGLQGTFLAISCINGVFYAEQKTVTIPAPAAGLDYVSFSFNPTAVSASTLVTLITNMNSL